MKIAIGCDHIVTDIKNRIVLYLRDEGYDVIDCGTFDFERTHYPIFGKQVGELVSANAVDRGVVLCGTGVGITNSVNKVQGVRCALVADVAAAKYARKELDANVIGFGGRVIGFGTIVDVLDTFLNTEYEKTDKNSRYIERINTSISEKLPSDIYDDLLEKWSCGSYHD